MNFEEAGRQYVILKDRFDNNLISLEEFEHSVGKLATIAPDGKKWKLDPFAGTWVEVAPGEIPVPSKKRGTGAPETLLQFVFVFIKSLLKSLPKLIMIGLLMAVLTWVAHTYIIAKVNDGLMYVAGRTALNSVVHLQQTHFPGVNAFWGLFAYFLSSFLMRAHSCF